MTDDRFDTLDPDLGGYLLGELEPEERARFERRLAAEPALRAQVERLAPVVRAPRRRARPGVGGAAAGTAAGDARADGGAPRRRWLPTLMPRAWAATALAAVALLAAGIGIGTLIDGGGSGGSAVPQGPAIVLAPLGGAPASASANARMVGPQPHAAARRRPAARARRQLLRGLAARRTRQSRAGRLVLGRRRRPRRRRAAAAGRRRPLPLPRRLAAADRRRRRALRRLSLRGSVS